jgi:hypothetical protein
MIKPRIAVMQPYFLPYVGYYQLISEVDTFVITDSYQYEKNSWISRNRIINNGAVEFISLPIRKGSHQLAIKDRYISREFSIEKFLKTIFHAYHKSHYYADFYPVVKEIISYGNYNLNDYLINSLEIILNYLKIDINFISLSELDINYKLSPQEKIISICKELDAKIYVNLPGGRDLYDKPTFENENIELKFIHPNYSPYPQNLTNKIQDRTFEPNLSIIDMIFSDGPTNTKIKHLPEYELVT